MWSALRLFAFAAAGLAIGALARFIFDLCYALWRRSSIARVEGDDRYVRDVADQLKFFNDRLNAAAGEAEARALVREQLPTLARDFRRAAALARPHHVALHYNFDAMYRQMLKTIADNQIEIVTPPLTHIGSILRRVLSPVTYERVIAPVLGDLVREWRDAEVAGRRAEAARIKWLWTPWHLGMHLLAMVPRSLLDLAAKLVRKLLLG
jgi:hypothetical protein